MIFCKKLGKTLDVTVFIFSRFTYSSSMMKFLCAFSFFFLLSTMHADAPADIEYGPLQKTLLSQIASAQKSAKRDLQLQLACLYINDQKEEEAFKTFLEALFHVPEQSHIISKHELSLYQDALSYYLEQSSLSPQERGVELEKRVLPILQDHPEYVEVRFLLAASFANQQKYCDFFKHFFTAYKASKTSFMAYRTLAILHIKLFEKARTIEEKNIQRNELQSYLKKAIHVYGVDPTLYKLQIVFAAPKDKKQVVREVLGEIIRSNVVIPRGDIPFYIHESLEQNDRASARCFLDKTEAHYQYSRIIAEMRRVIDDESSIR